VDKRDRPPAMELLHHALFEESAEKPAMDWDPAIRLRPGSAAAAGPDDITAQLKRLQKQKLSRYIAPTAADSMGSTAESDARQWCPHSTVLPGLNGCSRYQPDSYSSAYPPSPESPRRAPTRSLTWSGQRPSSSSATLGMLPSIESTVGAKGSEVPQEFNSSGQGSTDRDCTRSPYRTIPGKSFSCTSP